MDDIDSCRGKHWGVVPFFELVKGPHHSIWHVVREHLRTNLNFVIVLCT